MNDDALIDPAACDALGPAADALEKGVNELRSKLGQEVLKVTEMKGQERFCFFYE